jgi:hypothetical protein
MKKYKGMVVQRCYIPVELEVEDDTSLVTLIYLMKIEADPSKGSWEYETYDVEEIKNE